MELSLPTAASFGKSLPFSSDVHQGPVMCAADRNAFIRKFIQLIKHLEVKTFDFEAWMLRLMEKQDVQGAKQAAIDLMIEALFSQEEIEAVVKQLGEEILPEDYMDSGLHKYSFGKESFLGSVSSHLKAIKTNAFGWLLNNGPTLLGYYGTVSFVSGLVGFTHGAPLTVESGYEPVMLELSPDGDITPYVVGECVVPLGSYPHTCGNLSVGMVKTQDPYVGNICRLSAVCLNGQQNQVTFQEYFWGKDRLVPVVLSNIDGDLQAAPETTRIPFCVSQKQLSCRTAISSYDSVDPALSLVKMCHEKLICPGFKTDAVLQVGYGPGVRWSNEAQVYTVQQVEAST